MDDIRDILLKRDFDMPPEVRAVKEYVRRYYDADVTVKLDKKTIFISARSAALIGSLRLNVADLQKAAQTDKKIILRIS